MAERGGRCDPGVEAGLAMYDLLGQKPAVTAPFAQTGAQSDASKVFTGSPGPHSSPETG